MEELEIELVDSASAGAIGEPGHRVFMIQGHKNNVRVGVVVEKQQVELLANQSLEFLGSLQNEFPEEDVTLPDEFDAAGQVVPLEPIFRAQSMGLIFDPDTMLVTLELRELPFDESETIIDLTQVNHDKEKILRLTMTRNQLRALAVRGTESVNAGREPCPLCQSPMDPMGHVCPRLN
jgi:uncharacterized repeat protein (TIGR03847 family)